MEAESVAYMVCAALGVDSAGYSLPYVAVWSGGEVEKVSETADRVIGCAGWMITDIEVDQHLERSRSVAVVTSRDQPNEKTYQKKETREVWAEITGLIVEEPNVDSHRFSEASKKVAIRTSSPVST